jgi:hypothetical protein
MRILLRGIVQPEEAVERQKEGIGGEVNGEEDPKADVVKRIRFLPSVSTQP